MIDVHIYAVEQRRENVETLLKAIPNAVVHWDTYEGSIRESYNQNCRSAWLAPIPEGVTHRIVLADDAGVCDNFLKIAQKCADKFPDALWAFCTVHPAEDDKPYSIICSKFPMGVGMMMPVQHIRPIYEPWVITREQAAGKGWYTNTDETVVEKNVRKNKLTLMSTNPNIVSHVAIGGSILNEGRPNEYASGSFVQKPSLKRFDNGEVGLVIA